MNWKPGERVYRRVWTGLGGAAAFRQEPVTVVRVSKYTLTVRTESGSQLRLRGGDIVGPCIGATGQELADRFGVSRAHVNKLRTDAS